MAKYASSNGTLVVPEELGDPKDIIREDLYPDKSAFILRNVLSPQACDEIIANATGLGMRDSGYSKQIRITDRVVATSEALGKALFKRVASYLGGSIEVTTPHRIDGKIDESGEVIPAQRGIIESEWHHRAGVWEPHGLNECFRICRYGPGGFFAPHHDGGFERTAKDRSMKTIMLYLNDEFEGGNTNFYNETQVHYSKPDLSKLERSFQPTKGSCLIFNSAITHDGQPLISGEKWILRSEIMYRYHPKKMPLEIAVGTGSTIKINAAKRFFQNCTILACPTVESGVRPQPVGAEETAKGAKNRAMAALAAHPQADIGVGIENGMMWETEITLASGKKQKIPIETPSDPSIFNSAVNGETLVDKACIAIIKRKKGPRKENDECSSETTKFFWSESIIIPPVDKRPFNEGPNGEWSELKDPHAVLTHGRKNRENFLFETFAFAEDFVWSENLGNVQEALNLIAEAEAFERQGRFQEAIGRYKMARKKAPEVCDARGL